MFRDHRLKRCDGDPLGAVESPASSKHVTGKAPQMVRERVLCLARQRNPVDEEQDTGDDARLEQPLDEGGGSARLAGSRCHLHLKFATSVRDFGGQRLYAFDLAIKVNDPSVDFDLGQIAAALAHCDPPFKVVLGVEAGDLARMGVGFAVKKPHLLAVRQEGERHAGCWAW